MISWVERSILTNINGLVGWLFVGRWSVSMPAPKGLENEFMWVFDESMALLAREAK